MAVRKDPNHFSGIAATLIRFSLPLIFSGILQQLYSWADAFIVGNVVGELALAAVGATGSVISFCLLAINGFTAGLTILFGQRFGAGRTDVIPRILSTFTVALGGVFVLLAAAGAASAAPLLELLHTPADALPMSAAYLRILFWGVPFLAVYNVYSAALRGVGDSRAPFWAILVSSVVNIVLDLLFVAALGWGVTGAAAATVLSQLAMTLFIVAYAAWRHPELRFRLGRRMVDAQALRQGLHFGVPPMIQSSVTAFGHLILQNFMNGFGTQTVAAITSAYRVDSMALLPIINLGSGISTITAQDYGAGNIRRTSRILWVGSALMAVVSLMLTALIVPTGGPLIALFGAGEEAVQIGRDFFARLASFYVVFGLATAVRGYLEGMGDMKTSSAIGMASLAVRIIGSYAMEPLGNMVIAYAECVAWTVLLALYVLRAVWYRKHRLPQEA